MKWNIQAESGWLAKLVAGIEPPKQEAAYETTEQALERLSAVTQPTRG
jgi:hypothetical protein